MTYKSTDKMYFWDVDTNSQKFDTAGNALEIHVPDPLRRSVEAATGGQCTVLYDDFDLPSYMRIIPAMNAADLITLSPAATGLHPAFLADGTKLPEIFIGMYQAYEIGGKAYSLPGKNPWVSIDFDDARAACVSKGDGWHLMTNWEWAAVALWCMKNSFQPRGNTNNGRAHDATFETGVRQDGATYVPGDSDGVGNILTGSGPKAWRHDGTPAGIADLTGNVWEWVDGFKLVDGQVLMLPDNNVNLCTKEADEASWMQVGLEPGAHETLGDEVDTGTLTNGVQYKITATEENHFGAGLDVDDYFISDGTETCDSNNKVKPLLGHFFSDEGSVRLQNESGTQTDNARSVTWSSMVKIAGYKESQLMRLGLISPAGVSPQGTFYMRSADTRLPFRGGARSHGSNAGLAALYLAHVRGLTGTFLGFRPAFIKPEYL